MASVGLMVPEGFRVDSSDTGGTIAWKGPAYWAFVVVGAVGLVLSGALLAVFALTTGELRGATFIFGAGALLSAYVLLVGLCNSTRVRVRGGRLEAQHGPLPCPFRRLFCVGRRKEFPASDVTRLHVQEVPRREGGVPQREAEGAACAVGGVQSWPVARSEYQVEVVLRDGARKPLLTRLSAEEARYVERELAGLLGLAGG
jgi:hypothetical protein